MTQQSLSITFGLHLDGQRVSQPGSRLGEAVVGPLGFLAILQTLLGLSQKSVSQAERITQYRDCLLAVDSSDRFYHDSLAVDALGTAATLLNWRDEWYLQGWSGRFSSACGRRLRDMAKVERRACQRVAPGPGESLALVRDEMEGVVLPIAQVTLLEPLKHYPLSWQWILERLPCHQLEYMPRGSGFLGELQKALLQARSGQIERRLNWKEDGSVRVVQGETRFTAAAWLTHRLEPGFAHLILAQSNAEQLDRQLGRAGRPLEGMRESSAYRPALQVLPLVMELLWQPLDFDVLIQFLTHPICPLPRFARLKAAEKVAEYPGVQGQRWQELLGVIDDHYGERAAEVRRAIDEWVDFERYSGLTGAPLDAVLEKVTGLKRFFQSHLGAKDDAVLAAYAAAHGQCRVCAQALSALQEQGEKTIRPRQLQKLVLQATSSGGENGRLVAELGAGLTADHPGAVFERVDQLVWWQLRMPVLPGSLPWSTAELKDLSREGVDIPSADLQLDRAAGDWLRPVMAAARELILVLPPSGEEIHPLWQMVCAVVDKPKVLQLEGLLEGGDPALTAREYRPLPDRRRWWQLPPGAPIPQRREESFSSLSLFLFNPYAWLLRYGAQIRPSRIIASGPKARLLGNLAHGLVGRYAAWDDSLVKGDEAFASWFETAFTELITQDGASLLMAGQGAELMRFRHLLQRSLLALRSGLRQIGCGRLQTERCLEGMFSGGRLVGFSDLEAERPGNGRLLVDLKWSGQKSHGERLGRNGHLQLALYAELLAQQTGNAPDVLYFIFDTARFLAQEAGIMPDADLFLSRNGEGTSELWQRFNETWRWRRQQLDHGAVEVVFDDIPATAESQPPPGCMDLEVLDPAYNEYRTLAGFGADQ